MDIRLAGLTEDIDKMVKKLYRIEEDALKVCRQIISELVVKFEKEAIRRVPVDTGNLEDGFSHKVIVAASKKAVLGEVFVSAMRLDFDYAIAMHEWDYGLGEKSIAKQASEGVDVGRKYLERALDDNEREFGMFIYNKLREYMR